MELRSLERRPVFGIIQRILHAWIGLIVLALIAMGWIPGPWKPMLGNLHISLGYGLIVGLVLRILWGVMGPSEARFRGFFSLRRKRWGHEPLASIVYLLFYLALAVGCFSGLLLAAMEYDRGIFAAQLFDDFTWHETVSVLHDLVSYAVTAFILAHIGALIVHEKEHGYPLAQAMLSGYQYRLSSSETQHEKTHPSCPDSDNGAQRSDA